MPAKLSLLFQVVTTPTNTALARVHTGGWSETVWRSIDTFEMASIRLLAQMRSSMLSASAAIIGARTQVYTIVGNRLVPGGTNSFTLNYPGLFGFRTDLPQVAVSMTATTDGNANTRKFTLRGIPDHVMVGGEYQPDANFIAAMNLYINQLKSGVWWFPGRNLANPSFAIQGVADGILRTVGNPGWLQGESVRFLKARQTNGLPFTGTYVIGNQIGLLANEFRLANLDITVKIGTIGRVRKDAVALYRIDGAEPGRACVRKIGRPFETYHGRRSKRT